MTTWPRALGWFGCLVLLTASASAQASTITLAWDPNSEADLAGYKVYYDTDSGPPYSGTQAQEGASPIDVPLMSLADATMPELVLHGMPSCTTFYFAVTAYNTSSQESDYSSEISATALATPTAVTAAPSGAGAVHLTWTDPPSDDNGTIPTYHVQYDTDSGAPYSGTGATEGDSPIQVSTASLPDPANPSFDLSGLAAGTTYYFVVEADCDDGTSKTSTEVSAKTDASGAGGSGGGGATTGAGAGSASDGSGGGNFSGPAGAGGGANTTGAGGAGGSADQGGPADSGGCGCVVAGDGGGEAPLGLVLGLAGMALAAWRRRGVERRAARAA
jgi:MYXO-CTERM domain-containing protein